MGTDCNWYESWICDIKQKLGGKLKDKAELIERLNEIVNKFIPEMAAGLSERRISSSQVDIVLSEIASNRTFMDVYVMRDIFDRLVSYSCEVYGWHSAPIPKLLMLKRDKSRFTYQTGYLLHKYDSIRKDFYECLVVLGEGDIRARTALFYLSAIMFGGLLDKSLLENLLRLGFSHIKEHSGITWIDIQANTKRYTPGMLSRWFIDPVTLIILRNNREHLKKIHKYSESRNTFGIHVPNMDQLLKNIRDMIKRYSGSKEESFKTISELIDIVAADASLELPPYVLDHATGRNPAISINETSWYREIAYKFDAPVSEHELINETHASYIEDDILSLNTRGSDSACCDVASDASEHVVIVEGHLRHGDYNKARHEVELNSGTISKTARIVLEWHLKRFKKTADKRALIKIDQETYFRVGRMLIAFTLGQNILELHADDYEEICESVLARAFDQITNTEYSIILESFTKHIQKCAPQLKNVDLEDVEGYVKPGLTVNASVIGPGYYKDIKESLWKHHDTKDRLGWIRYLMVVVAYKLSLRRGEIRRMRLRDVVFTRTQAFISVKNTEYGTTKSISGNRRAPIHDLLSTEEMCILREWHEMRVTEADSEEALLFSIEAKEDGLISGHSTFNYILAVIRSVTGDSAIRFHSLRHSFPTWLLLRFEANRLGGLIDDKFEFMNKKSADSILPARFKSLLDGTKPTKKYLYQLSNLIGHASPAMTLLHYIHTCDLILHHWQKKNAPRFTKKQLAYLLGYKQSQLYEKLRKTESGTKAKLYNLEDCLRAGVARPTLLSCIW